MSSVPRGAVQGLWAIALCLPFLACGQNNLLVNPGFETGNSYGWGSCTVVSSNAHSGTYCAQLGYYGGAEQTVYGLLTNTTYTMSGWLEESVAGQRVYLLAENYGAGQVNTSTTSTNYTNLTITFTTGATNTSALVGAFQVGSSGYAYCDDFVLTGPTNAASGSGTVTLTNASRIADCLQRFGVNTFSLLTNNGYAWSWGGSAGQYDYPTVGRAINYVTGGSGLTMNIREYHRDFGGTPAVAMTPLQETWIRGVYQATGSPFTIAIAAYGTSNDVPGIVSLVEDSVSSGLNYVKWVEGVNEPDMYGPIASTDTANAQSLLFQQVHAITTNVTVMGPSIAVGLPYPDGWVTNYLGTNLTSVLGNSDANNLHVYPTESPNANDNSSRPGLLADFTTGYATVLPGKPAINTEWHPTLYSSTYKTNNTFDAYWGPIYFLSSVTDFKWQADFWFALYDYAPGMPCGLFVSSDADPKPVAKAFRALFQLTGDPGTNKTSFVPDQLSVTVSNLPAAPAGSAYAGGRCALFENSVGQFFLMIWNEQGTTNAATTPVTVTFNSNSVAKVEEFNITSGSETAVQSLTNLQTMTVNLDTSVRLLRITRSTAGRLQALNILGNGSPSLNFAGTPTHGYNVQRSTDLINWTTVLTTNAPVGGAFSFIDTFADQGGNQPVAAYYRLSWAP